MQFIDDRETVAAYVSQMIDPTVEPGFYNYDAGWLIVEDGIVTGGIVLSNYTGTSIALSLAGSSVFKRQNLHRIVDYVFRQLNDGNCHRLEVRIDENDKLLRRIVPRLGLQFESKAYDFYGEGQHGLVFSLTRSRNLNSFCSKWFRNLNTKI